jgi:hypothetical protein
VRLTLFVLRILTLMTGWLFLFSVAATSQTIHDHGRGSSYAPPSICRIGDWSHRAMELRLANKE